MDPLSITASVTGILRAAAKVISILRAVKDAPDSISKVLIEVTHIKIIFSALQKFLDRTFQLTPQRATLIKLDDIVVILTQTVLVFSELERFVTPLSARGKATPWQRISWSWEQSGFSRLVNQLQHHKTSLSLLLQIVQCESILEAEESSTSLREHIEQVLEGNSELSDRLQRLELPPGGVDLGELSSTPRVETLGEPDLPDRSHKSTHTPSLSHMDEIDLSRRSLDINLPATRVYDRVKHRDVDAMSSALTDRSHAWSLLSSLSLSELSVIAIVNLPLDDSELRSFWKLVTPDNDENISYPPDGIRVVDLKPSARLFTIQVNPLVPKRIEIEVSDTTTCLQLKEKIQNREGHLIRWQYLMCDETKKWIPEAAILSEHGITKGSLIHVLLPIWEFRYDDR